MQTVARIRKLGFRRWYERTLIEAHVHLITCLLGMILAFAGIEMVGARAGLAHGLLGIGVGAGGVALTIFGLQRYFRMISLAEHLGTRATCPACGTYGAFALLAGGPDDERPPKDAAETDQLWLRVKCRECGNTWML